MDIGHRMKELRIQYGLTQQELADRAELTKGFISQLERNQNSPSIGTLLDIIQCLKTDDYFEKIDEEKNCQIEWIVPNAQKNAMEPVRMTLHSGGRSEVYLPHEGEDFGYVIKGTVRISFGGKTQTVRAGESFYFKAGKKHYLENTSSRDAVLIWVTTPPNF